MTRVWLCPHGGSGQRTVGQRDNRLGGHRSAKMAPSLLAYCLSNTNTSLIDRPCPSVPTLVTVATFRPLRWCAYQ